MGLTHLMIMDNLDARGIYENLRFYTRNKSNREEVEFLDLKADKIRYQWEEERLKFLKLGTEVKLIYYSFPCRNPKKGLPRNTLEIEISGKEQARKDTIRRLEWITGIDIKE